MRKRLLPVAQWTMLLLVGAVAFNYLASGLGKGSSARAHVDSHPSVSSQPSLDLEVQQHDVADAVADLDKEFARHWAARGVSPAPSANWESVCRRISLALVGSGLSLEELRTLESLPPSQRVDQCLESLLADPRFHHYWGERFARTFVGTGEGPAIAFRRHRFVSWLSEQFARNRPYDVLIRRLVTAEGLFTDRPEVNFLTVTLDSAEEGQPDPVRLAARSARVFLGMRIDCLQCHDDFLGNVELGTPSQPRMGTQHDFHQLAAYFASARFNGFQGVRNGRHAYQYQYLVETEATEVTPAVPFGAELVDETIDDPRRRLAHWLTHPNNRQAARATVNRVWALLFGKPLSAPVDDIPLHGPLPPGMDRLADDLVEHDWNLRRLVRVIVASQVFQLDSRSTEAIDERHEQAWAVFPLTPLRPEQVAGAIIQASRIKTVDREGAFLVQLQKWFDSDEFVQRYGDTGEDQFNVEAMTITQRLLMLNGKLVGEYTDENPILNACTHIDMFTEKPEQAVEACYLAVLNRRPTDREREHFVARLEQSSMRREAIEDLYWVLFNSTEMAWNH